MKLIHLSRLTPDGRTFEYHRVRDMTILNSQLMMVTIGSWSTREEAFLSSTPPATCDIEMANDPDIYFTLLDEVLKLSAWAGGVLVDAVDPVPEPEVPAGEVIFNVGAM